MGREFDRDRRGSAWDSRPPRPSPRAYRQGNRNRKQEAGPEGRWDRR